MSFFNQEKFYDKNTNEQEVQKILDYHFRVKLTHDLSKNMPENKLNQLENYPDYEKVLKPYNIDWQSIEKYNQTNSDRIKSDFLEDGNPNIAWKLHLNTSPEFIKTASEHLLQNGYVHKYLSGGEIEDGKLFTVYIGSYTKAQELSNDISHILKPYLSKPVDHTEIEFAEGIIGRFVGPKKEFHQYGTCGFSLLNEDVQDLYHLRYEKDIQKKEAKKVELTRKAESKAFTLLQKSYGDYFFKV